MTETYMQKTPLQNPNNTHTKMYSFVKIHTEKYPNQDPITSAHITIQSETSGLSCNLPVLINILHVFYFKQASKRSTARLSFPHYLRIDDEYTQLVKFRTCLTRVKGSEAMGRLDNNFSVLSVTCTMNLPLLIYALSQHFGLDQQKESNSEPA